MVYRMDTKLTLKLDRDIIQKAKKYAKKRNISLSRLIENQLRALVEISGKNEEKYASDVELLIGIFETKEDEA